MHSASRPAFDLEHLLALKLETRVGKVKGNAYAGHAVGREPFFAEPDVRLKANLARVQFLVEPLDAVLQNASRECAKGGRTGAGPAAPRPTSDAILVVRYAQWAQSHLESFHRDRGRARKVGSNNQL